MADKVGVDAVAVQVLRPEAGRSLRDQMEGAGPPTQPGHPCGGQSRH